VLGTYARKPWLLLPAELAHDLGPWAVAGASAVLGQAESPRWSSLTWQGLQFPNPLGIAGGVDKNARNVDHWRRLGAGFVEVGTVTPKPQGRNPGVIIDRHIPSERLWNRLGFPSDGAHRVRTRLEQVRNLGRFNSPIFVNIGKNRSTADDVSDYAEAMQVLTPVSDAFVVNISSPNTTGLRDLLRPERLRPFLQELMTARPPNTACPLLLKLSPDVTDEELEKTLDLALDAGVSGFVLTNTLANGPHLGAAAFPHHDGGGVSGRPLGSVSEHKLQLARRFIDSAAADRHVLLVSVGGVLTGEDVRRRLELGADLVQVYSTLVFSGPRFFLNVAREEWTRNQ
jgi:dihydroorotate dehydrogenase